MTRSTETIEDEIERTRARIESRLDNLGSELSPVNLIESALGTRGASTTDTLSAVAHRARENPLSAILMGAGVAALFFAGRSAENPPASDRTTREPDDYQARRATVGDPAENVSSHISSLKQEVSTGVDDGLAAVRETVAGARETVAEARRKAGHKFDQARAAAVDTAQNAPVAARAGTENAVEWVKENPVPAGLIAIAAGATIASLFTVRNANSPKSRMEASRELHDQAEEEVRTPVRRKPETKATATKSTTRKTTRKKSATKPATKSKKAKTVSSKNAQRAMESGENLIRSTATLGEKPAKR